MLGLLLSSVLALGPGETAPTTEVYEGPTTPSELEPTIDPVESTEPVEPERRLSKGETLLVVGSAMYGLGAAAHWATVGASGMLEGARPGGTSAVTLGMTLGGMFMAQGPVLAGVGGRELARASQGNDHLARPMLAGGAVITTLGAGAILGSLVFMPTIRPRCPIDLGCTLIGTQLGGAALATGVGMMSYGQRLRERQPGYARLSQRTQKALFGGAGAFGASYVISATMGLVNWQENPDSALARRFRNRMLIPVVGPWIHAAGPDAPLIIAMVTGVLGAAQIGGAVAMAVGGGMAARERKRNRERRGYVRVVPKLDGIAVVGKF